LAVVVGVLALVLVFELLSRTRSRLPAPGPDPGPDPGNDAELVSGACDLGVGACRAVLADGGAVEVTLAPRPIPLAQPLTVNATLEGAAPERAELRIRSTTMSMGTTRFRLEPNGPTWSGNNQLPVCVSGTMVWLATLRLDGDDVAHFRFETRTP
jgi:hypothetical protein